MSNRNESEQSSVEAITRAAPPQAHFWPHIFITGRAGHGKDSIGDHLIDQYGFDRMSFSDGIRKEITVAYAGSVLPVTTKWQDTREIKEEPQNRLALIHCNDQQFVKICMHHFEREDAKLSLDALEKSESGSEKAHFTVADRMELPRSPRRIQQMWGTEYRREQDSLYWLKYAEEKTDFSKPQVLTSVRYLNELEFGERIHAVRIHVERPGLVEAADHVTEKKLPFDEKTVVIQNTGSLSELHAHVNAVMDHIRAHVGAHARKKISP